MIRCILAFALGILADQLWWRRRVERALLADDADTLRLWRERSPGSWRDIPGHNPGGSPIEDDDGIQPADPYLDWLCVSSTAEPHRKETTP